MLIDLGCGAGAYTEALRARGAEVLPIDNDPEALAAAGLRPRARCSPTPARYQLRDGYADGVVCSNLLEHTPDPEAVLREIVRVVRPGGFAYVSWTNWYSPWGGHEFVPYQYLGPALLGPSGPPALARPCPQERLPGGLWYTHIGRTIAYRARARTGCGVERIEPRYWPRLRFIVGIPVLREVLTWNCVIHVRRI